MRHLTRSQVAKANDELALARFICPQVKDRPMYAVLVETDLTLNADLVGGFQER
jgi:hypothetical protein